MSLDKEYLSQAEINLEYDLVRDIHKAYLEAAAGALQRTIMRAERAAALSAGLSTSYVALYALHPAGSSVEVGWVGLLPALWFGASIAGYGIFITATGNREYVARPLALAMTESNRTGRLRAFVHWVNRTALRRRWALEIGTISMVSGVIAMALPFVAPSRLEFHYLALLPWGVYLIALVLRRSNEKRHVNRAGSDASARVL